MNNAAKLTRLIESNNGIVTSKDASRNVIPRQNLFLFVREGKLERITQGIYLAPEAFADTMYIIQVRSPKIIFSHETALYIHELTDRDPLHYTVSVPRRYGIDRLRKSGIVVYTVKESLHEIGKETTKTTHGRDIAVYDMERTICDILRYRNKTDGDMFATALKRYALRKDKNLSRLMAYAKLFRVEKPARQYMEVLI